MPTSVCSRGAGPRPVGRVEHDLPEEDDRDDPGDPDPDAVVEAPRPGTAPVDDVLLAQPRLLGAEEARPRDHPPDDEVDEAAEADDDEHGEDERRDDGVVRRMAEPEERGWARQHRDEGRDAGKLPQLPGEGDRLLARPKGRPCYVRSRHGSESVDVKIIA